VYALRRSFLQVCRCKRKHKKIFLSKKNGFMSMFFLFDVVVIIVIIAVVEAAAEMIISR